MDFPLFFQIWCFLLFFHTFPFLNTAAFPAAVFSLFLFTNLKHFCHWLFIIYLIFRHHSLYGIVYDSIRQTNEALSQKVSCPTWISIQKRQTTNLSFLNKDVKKDSYIFFLFLSPFRKNCRGMTPRLFSCWGSGFPIISATIS